MTYKIYTCQQLTRFLCLSILLLSGCTEQSDDMLMTSEETRSNSTVGSEPIANLEERTFFTLQSAFPSPILDEDFKTLGALANSDTYLAFLSRTFKPVKPFQNFDEFLETVPPDAEKKIRPILKKHLAHLAINDQDIAGFYEFAITDQSVTILKNLNFRFHLMPQRIKEAEERAVKNVPLFRWFPPKDFDPHIRQAFWKDYVKFVEDANETARKKTQNTLHEHGQDDGLIWLAIQEPRILGIIVNTFIEPVTPADFLRWIELEGQAN